MKKSIVVLVLAAIVAVGSIYYVSYNREYLRIHIRANSNEEFDQSVKTIIAKKVNEYLEERLLTSESFSESVKIAQSELGNVERIIDDELKGFGLNYSSKAEIKSEYFPTRSYGSTVFFSGEYLGIIVTLGEGAGDNWWCVVYPPLCYLNGKNTNGKRIVYKSKIIEWYEDLSEKNERREE